MKIPARFSELEPLAGHYAYKYTKDGFSERIGLTYDDLYQDLVEKLLITLNNDPECEEPLLRRILKNCAIDKYRYHRHRYDTNEFMTNQQNDEIPDEKSLTYSDDICTCDFMNRLLEMLEPHPMERKLFVAKLWSKSIISMKTHADLINSCAFCNDCDGSEYSIATAIGLSFSRRYYNLRRSLQKLVTDYMKKAGSTKE